MDISNAVVSIVESEEEERNGTILSLSNHIGKNFYLHLDFRNCVESDESDESDDEDVSDDEVLGVKPKEGLIEELKQNEGFEKNFLKIHLKVSTGDDSKKVRSQLLKSINSYMRVHHESVDQLCPKKSGVLWYLLKKFSYDEFKDLFSVDALCSKKATVGLCFIKGSKVVVYKITFATDGSQVVDAQDKVY